MENKTLEKLFVKHLKCMYSSEKQLSETLPRIAESVAHKDLKSVIKDHYEQTKVHLDRVHKILQQYNLNKASGEYCDIMEQLLDEAEDLLEEYGSSEVLDSELIALCRKIGHYEIASYNTLVSYARLLNYEEASELLQLTLDEEYETDNKFNKLNEEVMDVYIRG